MAGNQWFQFKQFRIEQHRASMKVGTDGVLLGAWCNVDTASRVLDIGTGTGLIALMIAQRSGATVDAVELNEEAAADAQHNFQQSPWGDRLNLITTDFRQFSQETNHRYDLIVSNPPFFVNALRPCHPGSAMARHTGTLPFEALLKGAAELLTTNGRLAVIIPSDSYDDFREEARMAGFYLKHKCSVFPKPGKAEKRVLLEFRLEPCYAQTSSLTISTAENQYTEAYSALTTPFYLNL